MEVSPTKTALGDMPQNKMRTTFSESQTAFAAEIVTLLSNFMLYPVSKYAQTLHRGL